MEMVLNQVCSNCGNARLPDGRFCLFCGDLLSETTPKGSAFSQLTTTLVSSAPADMADPEYAGFWLRAWAGAIDVALEASGALLLTSTMDLALRRFGYLLGISPFVSKVATGVAFIAILSVGSWLYSAFSESSSWRATVGKRILGLQVVTADGDKVSFGQATIRHLMKFLSLFFLTIGFMMAGWTKRRQALHDMPSDCLVIRVPREKGFTLLRG
ncbi:MAG: RDD family protein [Candidatus Korobacteraceae bacterium]